MTAPRYGSWGLDRHDMTSTVTPLDTRGPKRLWSQGPGYVIRRRGATDEPVTLEFCCPVHGRFTAKVSKVDTPDEMPCPTRGFCEECAGNGYPHVRSALFDPVRHVQCVCGGTGLSVDVDQICGLTSPWSPSSVAVWRPAGEVTG